VAPWIADAGDSEAAEVRRPARVRTPRAPSGG
jgi:hypothetical protein